METGAAPLLHVDAPSTRMFRSSMNSTMNSTDRNSVTGGSGSGSGSGNGGYGASSSDLSLSLSLSSSSSNTSIPVLAVGTLMYVCMYVCMFVCMYLCIYEYLIYV